MFEHDEPGAVRRIDGAGLVARSEPTPVVGRKLALRPALFDDDALIWDRLASRSLVYGAPGGAALAIAFPDTPMLGVWQKPGARYVCTQFIAEDNDFKLPEYWLFDAGLSYKKKNLALRLNLKNIGDKEYYSRGFTDQAVLPANPFAVYAAVQLSLGARP